MTKVHYYKGYAIDKPEGCKMWNIHKIVNGDRIQWCFVEATVTNIKEAKITIDSMY